MCKLCLFRFIYKYLNTKYIFWQNLHQQQATLPSVLSDSLHLKCQHRLSGIYTQNNRAENADIGTHLHIYA